MQYFNTIYLPWISPGFTHRISYVCFGFRTQKLSDHHNETRSDRVFKWVGNNFAVKNFGSMVIINYFVSHLFEAVANNYGNFTLN